MERRSSARWAAAAPPEVGFELAVERIRLPTSTAVLCAPQAPGRRCRRVPARVPGARAMALGQLAGSGERLAAPQARTRPRRRRARPTSSARKDVERRLEPAEQVVRQHQAPCEVRLEPSPSPGPSDRGTRLHGPPRRAQERHRRAAGRSRACGGLPAARPRTRSRLRFRRTRANPRLRSRGSARRRPGWQPRCVRGVRPRCAPFASNDEQPARAHLVFVQVECARRQREVDEVVEREPVVRAERRALVARASRACRPLRRSQARADPDGKAVDGARRWMSALDISRFAFEDLARENGNMGLPPLCKRSSADARSTDDAMARAPRARGDRRRPPAGESMNLRRGAFIVGKGSSSQRSTSSSWTPDRPRSAPPLAPGCESGRAAARAGRRCEHRVKRRRRLPAQRLHEPQRRLRGRDLLRVVDHAARRRAPATRRALRERSRKKLRTRDLLGCFERAQQVAREPLDPREQRLCDTGGEGQRELDPSRSPCTTSTRGRLSMTTAASSSRNPDRDDHHASPAERSSRRSSSRCRDSKKGVARARRRRRSHRVCRRSIEASRLILRGLTPAVNALDAD